MLSKTERNTLKKRAHPLHPLVQLGHKGLTEAVQKEIGVALEIHELMKVQVTGDDKDARNALIEEICTFQGAELIQAIGRVAVIYKKRIG